MKPIEPSGLDDREETLKYFDDLDLQTPFSTLGDTYLEHLRAALNYAPRYNKNNFTFNPIEINSGSKHKKNDNEPSDNQTEPNLADYKTITIHSYSSDSYEKNDDRIQPVLMRLVDKDTNEEIELFYLKADLNTFYLNNKHSSYLTVNKYDGIDKKTTKLHRNNLLKIHKGKNLRLDFLFEDTRKKLHNTLYIHDTERPEDIVNGSFSVLFDDTVVSREFTTKSSAYLNFVLSIDVMSGKKEIETIDYSLSNGFAKFNLSTLVNPLESFGFNPPLALRNYLMVSDDKKVFEEYDYNKEQGKYVLREDKGCKVKLVSHQKNGIILFKKLDQNIEYIWIGWLNYSMVERGDIDVYQYIQYRLQLEGNFSIVENIHQDVGFLNKIKIIDPPLPKYDDKLKELSFKLIIKNILYITPYGENIYIKNKSGIFENISSYSRLNDVIELDNVTYLYCNPPNPHNFTSLFVSLGFSFNSDFITKFEKDYISGSLDSLDDCLIHLFTKSDFLGNQNPLAYINHIENGTDIELVYKSFNFTEGEPI